MAELNFDDLIPKDGKGVSFDDLVPQAAPSQGVWDTIKTQAGNGLQAADDIARIIANHASLGYADKLASYMNGTPLEQERAASKAADDRAGWAGTAAGLLGSMGPWGAVSKGLGAAGMASPYLNAAATGAITGTGDAAGNDRNLLEGAGIGAASGVAGNALAKGLTGAVDKVAGAFNKAPQPLSADALEAAKTAAYQRADAAGGIVNDTAMQRLAAALRGEAANFGYDPAMQPKTAGFFNRLGDYEGQNVTMKGMDTLRKIAGRTWEGGNSDAELGRRLKGIIDDFTGNLGPSDIIAGAGNPQAANAAFTEARSLAQRGFKSADLQDAIERQVNATAHSGTGGNIDNNIRKVGSKLLNSDTAWTPDERAALEDLTRGDWLRNTARQLGRFSPVGNGLTASLEAIPAAAHMAVTGNAAAAAPYLAIAGGGYASKKLADALTQRAADRVGDLIRSGGNASALQAPPNAVQLAAQKSREALARALMGGGVSYGVPALAEQQ